jgi:GNAT superfamily N-acetyltransferase
MLAGAGRKRGDADYGNFSSQAKAPLLASPAAFDRYIRPFVPPSSSYPVVNTLSEAQILQLHALYQQEWWSVGRSLEDVRAMLDHCLVFGVVHPGSQDLLAFARVLTDRDFKAFLFDVIVHPDHRSEGVGTFLLRQIVQHPELANVRHIELYCLPERAAFYRRHDFDTDLGEILLMRRTNPE